MIGKLAACDLDPYQPNLLYPNIFQNVQNAYKIKDRQICFCMVYFAKIYSVGYGTEKNLSSE